MLRFARNDGKEEEQKKSNPRSSTRHTRACPEYLVRTDTYAIIRPIYLLGKLLVAMIVKENYKFCLKILNVY